MGAVFAFVLFLSYVMSIIKWFITDHFSFWNGFKELVWALCPIINITYVWDWWATGIMFIVYLIMWVYQAVVPQ